MASGLTTMRWPRVREHHTVGASTGYMTSARGDWPLMARLAAESSIAAVELSSLSEPELPALLDWLSSEPRLPFWWVAVHAPTKAREMPEPALIDVLADLACRVDAIVVHPDAMGDVAPYRRLGAKLAIENMDTGKALGRTADELEPLFAELPDARLCFDVAHAAAVDPTMHEGQRILDRFGARLSHVHVSSLDEDCHHVSLTPEDERRFAPLLDRCRDVPWVLEAPLRN